MELSDRAPVHMASQKLRAKMPSLDGVIWDE